MARRSRPTLAAKLPLSNNDASRLNLGSARRAAPTFFSREVFTHQRRGSALQKPKVGMARRSRPTLAAKLPLSNNDASHEIWLFCKKSICVHSHYSWLSLHYGDNLP